MNDVSGAVHTDGHSDTPASGPGGVVGGVDTHKDSHTVVALDLLGRRLGAATFASDEAGCAALLAWLSGFGPVTGVGIEGTGSYGARLARAAAAGGLRVVEVARPNRAMRRLRGKNDTVDAEAAARAVLAGYATATPKSGDGIVESIRQLLVVVRATTQRRTQMLNQFHALATTAPAAVAKTLPAEVDHAVTAAARWRPTADLADPAVACKTALRVLASQIRAAEADLATLRGQLDELTLQANPALTKAGLRRRPRGRRGAAGRRR